MTGPGGSATRKLRSGPRGEVAERSIAAVLKAAYFCLIHAHWWPLAWPVSALDPTFDPTFGANLGPVGLPSGGVLLLLPGRKPVRWVSQVCECGANCEDRRHPAWLLSQLAEARSGFLAVAGIQTDGFCCPLCVRVLPETCATIAHSPSKEVGGDGQTFLCKACNSYLGTAYEAAASEWLSRIIEARATRGTTHKVALRHGKGTRLYADAVLSGEGRDHGIQAQLRGKNRKAQDRFAADSKSGEALSISLRLPNESTIKLAYLSWAYLLLFRRLGYVFVFSRSGRQTREALLIDSVTRLGPAFFSIRQGFTGDTSPMATGLLVRPSVISDMSLAIAADIGGVVIALPLTDDPGDRYGHLATYINERNGLVVLPFDGIYPGPALPGLADYRYQTADGVRHRVVAASQTEVAESIGAGHAPASGRRAQVDSDSAWEAPSLTLPAQPRSDTWRMCAADYLAAQGIHTARSTSNEEDSGWIERVAAIDRVASQHVSDMCRLFRDGQDPRELGGMSPTRLIADINAIIATYGSGGRLIAFDEHLLERDEFYVSMCGRVLIGTSDVIVGPYFAYDTFVVALRQALEAG